MSNVKPEISTIIGKPLETGEKIIYPVIRISILKNNEGNTKAIWVIPIAIVVEEDSKRFFIPLVDENIDFDTILELLPVY